MIFRVEEALLKKGNESSTEVLAPPPYLSDFVNSPQDIPAKDFSFSLAAMSPMSSL